MAENTYDIGDGVRIRGTFRDEFDQLGDPTDVVVDVIAPDGTRTTYHRSAGEVTRESLGVYSTEVTPDKSGRWSYRFLGTATLKAAGERTFYVRPTQFV